MHWFERAVGNLFHCWGESVGEVICCSLCMSPFCRGLRGGLSSCQADGLVYSVTQLLQASLREEEVPQVGILSFRHWGDDGFFSAFLTKVATQWSHGLHSPAEELSLQFSVSLCLPGSLGSDGTFGPWEPSPAGMARSPAMFLGVLCVLHS